uniref:Reverse transcriptase domain-containing protein n=1 Tax=Dictyostelium discoideum TaxID=44689 RepID=O96849_DICDI|nr:ORF3 [Dictyostelium discoideum]
MLNPIPISIPEGPKSDCITKEVQDLLLDDAIEQVLPNHYSKRVFYSNVFTVPKPGTNLHRPVLDLKRLNTYINNQSFKMEGIKNLPSMVKQGYYMVKLDIKKAYLHVLVDPQYRDLFRFVWKGSHYRWKTMPFGLSTAPRIFTMLLRPVLRMLRDINVSVIAYLDDLLIVGSTKEECLSNLKKTMDLLVKLGFKLNLEKSVLEPTQSITFLGLQIDSVSMKLLVPKEKKKSVIKEIRNFLKLDCCSPRKLAGLKGKLIALKDAVIPFRLYTRRTNNFHSQCLTLANGDWDQSFPIPQDVKSEISHWLIVLNQWNGKEISLFPSYDYVLTTDASESGAGATLKKGNKVIKTWSFQWSTTQSNMSSNRREMLALLMAYQALCRKLNSCKLKIQTDNTTTLSYINRQGGQIQDLSVLFEQLWKQCLKKKVNLIGEHIPGFFNVKADHLSRLSEMNHKSSTRVIKSYNWQLKKEVFNRIQLQFGQIQMDLFASHLNHQTTNYSTIRMNTLHLDWSQWKQCLAFPPPILLPSILEKMNSSSSKKVSIILIFPIWRSATWYPMIQAQVPRHHRHMFPQVLGTFQEVLTKQSVESIPIQIQQRWKLGIIQLSNLM